MKILMVCLGNICRSPLAEGILKHKIASQEMDWEIDSAGTGAWHAGEAPDPRSINEAKMNGIDISQQRARKFQLEDFQHYDLIFAMDKSNYADIIQQASEEEQRKKVKLIMNLVHDNQGQDVPDPYWDNNGFTRVFGMLDLASDAIIEKYK